MMPKHTILKYLKMSDNKPTGSKPKKLKKFYIALYMEAPWESNQQYEIEAENQGEANRVAGLLSAINTCEAGVSCIPGFQGINKIISCKKTCDEKIIQINY